jgi:hypothetical protein
MGGSVVPADQVHDFYLTEYKEAASAYFKGVDIGFLFLRFYFIINAALVAVLQLDDKILAKTGLSAYMPYLVPLVGMLFSVCLAILVPFHRRQLDNCLRRCRDIEGIYGIKGALFEKIEGTLKEPGRCLSATGGFYVVSALLFGLWFLAIPNVLGALMKMFGA